MTRHYIQEDSNNERNICQYNDNHMKVRNQQIPETVHILNTPLTADINKHNDYYDDDDGTNQYFGDCHPFVLLLSFNTNSSSM